jgi:hypothetical protein
VTCLSKKTIDVALTWTAPSSPPATALTLTVDDGKHVTSLGSVSPATTSYDDTSGHFNTTYTYAVTTWAGPWSSPPATVQVTTPKRC